MYILTPSIGSPGTYANSTKRAFCRTERDVFSRGFEGVSVSEEMAESGRHPARRLRRGLSGPRRETRPSSPGQAGRVKILQKSAVDPIRGSGISSSLSLSLLSVIRYSRPGPGAPKIILLRLIPACSPYGRRAICQPADPHSPCGSCPTAPHAPTSDFLVTPVLPRIPDPPLGGFNVK
jgi:hypothetical protein